MHIHLNSSSSRLFLNKILDELFDTLDTGWHKFRSARYVVRVSLSPLQKNLSHTIYINDSSCILWYFLVLSKHIYHGCPNGHKLRIFLVNFHRQSLSLFGWVTWGRGTNQYMTKSNMGGVHFWFIVLSETNFWKEVKNLSWGTLFWASEQVSGTRTWTL